MTSHPPFGQTVKTGLTIIAKALNHPQLARMWQKRGSSAAFKAPYMETLAIVNRQVKGFQKCGFTWGKDTGSIYTRTGKTVYFLLAGGNKRTQGKDIVRAKELARELKETEL